MSELTPDDSFDLPSAPVTIELSERDLQDAARILALLVGQGVSGSSDRGDAKADPTRQMMAKRARTTFLNRRRRNQIFGSNLFGEPGWDMLLSLYITEAMGPRNTVGRLVAFSGVSLTTALRWLDVLEGSDFIRRKQHPTDKRSALISLSEAGLAALDAYFSETLTEGL